MPIISTGQITITDLNDGYTLSITGGNRTFSYATSGTTPAPATSGTFGFTLFRGGVSITPTTYSWTANGVLSGTSATATFQPTLSNTYSVATPTSVTLTVTHEGNSLTTSVPVLVSQAPSNAVIDTIFVSAPAIYKDVADAATTGTYTTTTIQGKRYDGTATSNFGWITVTPNTTGTESARTDTSTTALTLTPATTSGVSSYVIKLYVAASGGTAITSQTLNVVFKGAVGSPGNSPVLYELGLSAAVIARSASNVLAPTSLVVSGFSTTAGTKSAYSGRFKIYEDGTLKYTSSADQATYTYTPSVATVGTIKTELYAAGGVTTLLDTQEVPVVVSGSSAMTFSLTNSAYPIPADTSGAVATYVGSGTSIQVLEGSELYTYVATLGTTAKTFTVGTPTLSVASAITVGDLSGATTTTAVVAQHSAMSNSVEAVVISYPLTYIRANGATGTQTVTQAITKVKTGTLGIRGSRQLYSTDAAYTSTYDFDGAGATAAGVASYAAKATALIATATAGSNPTTPINGDTVTFSNGSTYVYTITHNGTAWVTPGTVVDGSLLVTGSVTTAKINSNGLSIRDSAGNVILSAGASLAASSLNLPGTVSNVPVGWQNSAITISANGTLNNAGGGSVSIRGLGYTGDLNATFGKNLSTPFTSWYLGAQTLVVLTDGKVGNIALRLAGNTAYPRQNSYTPIDTAKTYRTRFWARPSSTTAGLLYFSLRQFLDNVGTAGPNNGGRSPYKPGGVTRATHISNFGDTWGEYSFTWSTSDWQAGVRYVEPEFLDNYSGAAGYWDIQDFTFEEVTEVVSAQTTATTASNNATTAVNTANAASNAAALANAAIANISSDDLLTPDEKPQIILDYNVIIAEQTGIGTQATSYGITTEKTAYDTAVTALTTYLTGLTTPVAWNTIAGNTTIVGATFRTNFQNVYTARQALLNKISAVAKTLADTAQSTATNAANAVGNIQQNRNFVQNFSKWNNYGTNYVTSNDRAANGLILIIPAASNMQGSDSPVMNLNSSLTYVVSFTAWVSTGSRTLYLDLYPDTLPESTVALTTSPALYKFTWSPNHPDAASCRLRFYAPGATGDVFVLTPQIEVASYTPWKPAVEDANDKLAKDSASILSATVSVNAVTGAGFRAGDLTWDAAGVRTSGKGVAMTPGGLIGHNGINTTFAIDSVTGNASFAGNISGATGTFTGSMQVGTSPTISGNTMTGSGAVINSNGTFALGNATRNITFNTSGMRVNGTVVDIMNLIPGASLPDYVRTYKGGVTPTVPVNTWMALQMDATALNNKLGAENTDAYRTLLAAGTYFYELSVPVKSNSSDTNDAVYTAIISNPPGTPSGNTQTVCGNVSVWEGTGKDGYWTTSYQCWQEYVPTGYTVLSTAGVNVVGDWQTATIFGVGRFTLTTPGYISAAIKTTDSFPTMTVVSRTGYSSTILRIWRDTSV